MENLSPCNDGEDLRLISLHRQKIPGDFLFLCIYMYSLNSGFNLFGKDRKAHEFNAKVRAPPVGCPVVHLTYLQTWCICLPKDQDE